MLPDVHEIPQPNTASTNPEPLLKVFLAHPRSLPRPCTQSEADDTSIHLQARRTHRTHGNIMAA